MLSPTSDHVDDRLDLLALLVVPELAQITAQDQLGRGQDGRRMVDDDGRGATSSGNTVDGRRSTATAARFRGQTTARAATQPGDWMGQYGVADQFRSVPWGILMDLIIPCLIHTPRDLESSDHFDSDRCSMSKSIRSPILLGFLTILTPKYGILVSNGLITSQILDPSEWSSESALSI